MDYCAEVRRRFAAPRLLSTGNRGSVAAEAEDRTLGLWVRFELEARGDSIVGCRFEVFGCPHSVAAASLIAEWLEGRSLASVDRLDIRDVARKLEIPVAKLGKLVRMEDAVASCVAQLRGV